MDIIKRLRIAEVLIFTLPSLLFLKYGVSAGQFVLFLMTNVCYHYFMFSFNDLMDKDKDYHDLEKRNRNPFLDHQYQKLATVLMVLSGSLLLLIGWFNPHKIHLNVLLFLIAFNYNAGIRAKNKPFLDILIHGAWILGMLGYGILFFDVPVTVRETTLLLHFFIISTAIELSQEMRDYEVDKETREVTTVVYIGLKNSRVVYTVLVVAFCLITPILVESAYLRYIPLLLIPLLFALPQDTDEQRANTLNVLMIFSFVAFLV